MQSKTNKKFTKKEKNKEFIKYLLNAFDWCEGRHSGIPDCCISSFVSGISGVEFHKSLTKKQNMEFYTRYTHVNYVPCKSCYKKKKFIKIKNNGISTQGKIIRALLEQFGEDFRK
jgi:hypothetical protein